MDPDATARRRQDPRKQGCRVILIYMSHMFAEASLELERCAANADSIARHCWINMHIRLIDKFEDGKSPHVDSIREEAMDKEAMEEDTGHNVHHNMKTELPPNGSGIHPPTKGPTTKIAAEALTLAGTVLFTVEFGTPDPPIVPYKAHGETTAINPNTADKQNRFTALREHESTS